ncbi:MAG TPA: nicotinate phosphoribosyltransferase [Candidatus Binataceae bacterium]|nr:nicotinate phosphoribosyltransferase [Candidatus Binataceae bacterium]
MPIDLRFDPGEVPLLTDFYQLTMAAAYFASGYNDNACFSMFARRLPPRRGFLVAAGLERLLEALEEFHFDAAALEFLDSLRLFSPEFLGFLGNLRFTGEVWAMPEGTIFFAPAPIVEIRAPLIEAQLLETLVLNQVGLASLIASKAARSLAAAGGRRLIDFGLRRSQGADAGLVAARASYLAGFAGTSNVLAGRRYGIPLYGTMAHSYVMAHEQEREAFDSYVKVFPRLSTLLVDTYDTLRGVENAAAVALELRQAGAKLQGIRLDSGDLLQLSRRARRILDQRGLAEVPIFASGNLDEYRIAELVRGGAPIDAFGVGTAMVVSADAPALDVAYKLVEYRGEPRMKTSTEKVTLPGRKQVFRACNATGGFYADLIGLFEESPASAAREFRPSPATVQPLLERVFADGRRMAPRPTLSDSRERFLESFAHLEPRYKDLERPDIYPVRPSAALNALLISEKLHAGRRQG